MMPTTICSTLREIMFDILDAGDVESRSTFDAEPGNCTFSMFSLARKRMNHIYNLDHRCKSAAENPAYNGQSFVEVFKNSVDVGSFVQDDPRSLRDIMAGINNGCKLLTMFRIRFLRRRKSALGRVKVYKETFRATLVLIFCSNPVITKLIKYCKKKAYIVHEILGIFF